MSSLSASVALNAAASNEARLPSIVIVITVTTASWSLPPEEEVGSDAWKGVERG